MIPPGHLTYFAGQLYEKTAFLREELFPGNRDISHYLLTHINMAFDSTVGGHACDSDTQISTRDSETVLWQQDGWHHSKLKGNSLKLHRVRKYILGRTWSNSL